MPDDETVKRTSLDIPREVWREVERVLNKDGLTFKDYALALIREDLRKRQEDKQ
jgi:hypothetical protein